MAYRLKVRRSVRLSETWPLPTARGAGSRSAGRAHEDGAKEEGGDALGVARGPLRAIVFFLMLEMASAGMVETPSTRMGATETSSHLMGTFAVLKISLTDSAISGPIPCCAQRGEGEQVGRDDNRDDNTSGRDRAVRGGEEDARHRG